VKQITPVGAASVQEAFTAQLILPEPAVPDPDVFRERARRCRELLKIAAVPEIIEQLTVWARDFDEEANKIDAEMAAARRALHHSMRRRA
jgi:hypothetical protein